MEVGGYEIQYVPQSLAIWIFFSFCFLFLPQLVGLKGYDLMTKIIVIVFMFPMSFVITNWIASR